MPGMHDAAREHVLDVFVDLDLESGARELYDLEQSAPAIVDEFLKLNIATAHRMLASQQGLVSAESLRKIVATLTAVRFIYAMRMATMECGARLRRPTGFKAVDDLGDGFAPRYGSLISEMGREVQIVMTLLAAYDDGLTDLSSLGLRDRRFIEKSDLEQRARSQLIIWRQQHGNKLETLLHTQMKYIRKRLLKIDAGLSNARRLQPANLLIANDVDAAPLPVLFNIVRMTVAILCHVISGDHVRETSKTVIETRGLDAILSWMTQSKKSRGPCPFPSLHRNLRASNNDVFTALRFALVQDDNMFPKAAVEKDYIMGKLVTLSSQAGRVRAGLQPLSYVELYDHYMAGPTDTDVSRDAELNARTLPEFSKPMRQALQPWLTWVVGEL